MKFERLESALNIRFFVIISVTILLVIGLNMRWNNSLVESLNMKREELGESLALIGAGDLFSGDENDLELLKKMKQDEADHQNWTDSIAPLVAEQKLILRQVRPMGIEQRGKLREEKLFLQVDGSVDGVLGFMHHLASMESPIYVSRYLVTTRSIGTGFVSVEIVVSKTLL